MGFKHWTDDEFWVLDTIINCYPFSEIPDEYNRRAKHQGLTVRRKVGIEQACKKRYPSVRATLGNYTCYSLAHALGFKPSRVRSWVTAGYLQVDKVGEAQFLTCVRPAYLKRFAQDYPRFLAAAEWECLAAVFGEFEATRLKTFEPFSKLRPVKVKHIPTGKIYPSAGKAAKAHFIDRKTLMNRIGGEWVRVA